MQWKSMSIVVVLVVLGVFTLLNLPAFLAPTTLSLGVAEVQAPLGLIMLGVTALVSALFLLFIVVQQAGALLETRRMTKELAAQRELADKAEASRVQELRLAVFAHMDESVRSLSAHLGEIEDKLDRALGQAPKSPV